LCESRRSDVSDELPNIRAPLLWQNAEYNLLVSVGISNTQQLVGGGNRHRYDNEDDNSSAGPAHIAAAAAAAERQREREKVINKMLAFRKSLRPSHQRPGDGHG